MCDYAVYDLKHDLEKFFDMFIKSSYAKRFEHGEASVVAGCSGVELAYDILDEHGIILLSIEPGYTANRSREYWLGWVVAYYLVMLARVLYCRVEDLLEKVLL